MSKLSTNKRYKNWKDNGTCIPLGPRVKELNWEQFQSPAIYEVVCKQTGRRYIGCSRRPDLRRSVHLFWLKNNRKCVNGNVFFGLASIDSDIVTHGVDSFYFDIVKTFSRDISKSELLDEEARIKEEIPLDQIYNAEVVYDGQVTTAGSRFVTIEPEMAQLHAELKPLKDAAARTHREYADARNEFRKKLHLLKRDVTSGAIDYKQRRAMWLVACAQRDVFKVAYHKASKLHIAKNREIAALNKLLIVKWTSATLATSNNSEEHHGNKR